MRERAVDARLGALLAAVIGLVSWRVEPNAGERPVDALAYVLIGLARAGLALWRRGPGPNAVS